MLCGRRSTIQERDESAAVTRAQPTATLGGDKLAAGMVAIHQKINHLLAQRGLRQRELAAALGISPQTATDLCKGRSQVTLAHLRRLIEFFGLRCDYWLDDTRLEPVAADQMVPALSRKLQELADTWLLHCDEPARLVVRLLAFATEHQQQYIEQFGALGPDEKRLLGFTSPGEGRVGRIRREPGPERGEA